MNPVQHILVVGVRVYRWVISPAKTFVFGPLGQCRFTPSCSAYALEAIARHGALAGSWLALKRIGRCHPWGGCGEDLVPEAKELGRGQEEASRKQKAESRNWKEGRNPKAEGSGKKEEGRRLKPVARGQWAVGRGSAGQ